MAIIFLLLISQTLLFPLQSLASQNESQPLENDTNLIRVGKISIDEDEEIPLYENPKGLELEDIQDEKNSIDEYIESSNILAYLKNNDKVAIIEEHELYSLVEFVQEIGEIKNSAQSEENYEESEILRGYIANKFLEIESDDNDDILDDDTDKSIEDDNRDVSANSEETMETKDKEQQDNSNQNSGNKINNINVTSSSSSVSVRGIAKVTIQVWSEPSTKSNELTTFPIGTVLNYKTIPSDKNWNEIKVDINGEEKVGYIQKKDVENSVSKQESLRGVAKKSPTNIRERASTKSNVVKKHPIGSVIEYKTFSKYWCEAIENGKIIG